VPRLLPRPRREGARNILDPVSYVTETLAMWVAGWRDRPLDPALEAAARVRMLDYAANVLGGGGREPVRVLARHAARHPGPFALPGGGRASGEWAAWVYGASAHVLECDDTHQPSSSHPGAPVISAALVAAVEAGASLAAVARAMVAGYEVMCRIASASGPAAEYERGFHPTGTAGVFGAAAAVAVVLGLEPDRVASALGVAGSLSSGSMSFLAGGGENKVLNAGHAAQAGLVAARLAADGFRGPSDPFSPPHGYFAGHNPRADPGALVAGLDHGPPAIERTSLKAHGCCRYEQAPIDAVLALREAHAIEPAEVAAVRVGVLSGGWALVAEPEAAKRRPANVVDAQFSMPFGAAIALLRGHALPSDHADASLADPGVHALMDRVHCYRDPALDALWPAHWPAEVTIELRGGRAVRQRVEHPKGDPENPLSPAELRAKLAGLAPEVAQEARDRLAALLLDGDLDGPAAQLAGTLVA
jgi:2-methylcitrate dehydratase PrpD